MLPFVSSFTTAFEGAHPFRALSEANYEFWRMQAKAGAERTRSVVKEAAPARRGRD